MVLACQRRASPASASSPSRREKLLNMHIRVRHRAGGARAVMVDINTTPLIDVMLVLLVMLIITIPIQLHAVNLNMPGPQRAAAEAARGGDHRHRLRRHAALERRAAGRPRGAGCALRERRRRPTSPKSLRAGSARAASVAAALPARSRGGCDGSSSRADSEHAARLMYVVVPRSRRRRTGGATPHPHRGQRRAGETRSTGSCWPRGGAAGGGAAAARGAAAGVRRLPAQKVTTFVELRYTCRGATCLLSRWSTASWSLPLALLPLGRDGAGAALFGAAVAGPGAGPGLWPAAPMLRPRMPAPPAPGRRVPMLGWRRNAALPTGLVFRQRPAPT